MSIIKVTRSKQTDLGIKVDHSKRRTNFLKEIIMNITSRRPLLKRLKHTDFF